jgi:hypothetical protein
VPIALAGGGVNPAAGQPPQMGSPTSHRLVLKISEDRYHGNAKYVVKVDGAPWGESVRPTRLIAPDDTTSFG